MPKYYLLDENKNLVEVLNIENNLFRTRLEKLHSELNNSDHSIEFVTQAQFNQLEADDQLVANTYYFITDDTTLEGLEAQLNQIIERLDNVEGGIADLYNFIEDYGSRLYALENKKLYQHNILIRGATGYDWFAISFCLLTNGTYKNAFTTMQQILNAIYDTYGDAKKLPASGRFVGKEGQTTSNADYNVITIRNNRVGNVNEYFRIGYLLPNGAYGDYQLGHSDVTNVEDTIIELI